MLIFIRVIFLSLKGLSYNFEEPKLTIWEYFYETSEHQELQY